MSVVTPWALRVRRAWHCAAHAVSAEDTATRSRTARRWPCLDAAPHAALSAERGAARAGSVLAALVAAALLAGLLACLAMRARRGAAATKGPANGGFAPPEPSDAGKPAAGQANPFGKEQHWTSDSDTSSLAKGGHRGATWGAPRRAALVRAQLPAAGPGRVAADMDVPWRPQAPLSSMALACWPCQGGCLAQHCHSINRE